MCVCCALRSAFFLLFCAVWVFRLGGAGEERGREGGVGGFGRAGREGGREGSGMCVCMCVCVCVCALGIGWIGWV